MYLVGVVLETAPNPPPCIYSTVGFLPFLAAVLRRIKYPGGFFSSYFLLKSSNNRPYRCFFHETWSLFKGLTEPEPVVLWFWFRFKDQEQMSLWFWLFLENWISVIANKFSNTCTNTGLISPASPLRPNILSTTTVRGLLQSSWMPFVAVRQHHDSSLCRDDIKSCYGSYNKMHVEE